MTAGMNELADNQNATMELIIRLTEEVEALSELCLTLQGRVATLEGDITLAEIACIIMRKIYATMGESIYSSLSSLSRDFPEASRRLLRIEQEFTFQDMAN